MAGLYECRDEGLKTAFLTGGMNAFAACFVIAMVTVFYHWAAYCWRDLLDLTDYRDWLGSGGNLVCICADTV